MQKVDSILDATASWLADRGIEKRIEMKMDSPEKVKLQKGNTEEKLCRLSSLERHILDLKGIGEEICQ